MDDGCDCCCLPDIDDHSNDDGHFDVVACYDGHGSCDDDFDDVYVDADGFYVVDLMQVTLLIDRLDLARLHLVHRVRKTYQIQPSIVK